MAEIAAGAVVAEEVVSTSAQAAVGTYMVAKPAMPLKASFRRIATAKDDATRLSLARSNHTVTVVGSRAYIFGGETTSSGTASNDIHAVTLQHSPDRAEPDYSIFPAVPVVRGEACPQKRTKHAACKLNKSVAVFGGETQPGKLADTEPLVWLFETEKHTWECVEIEYSGVVPVQRSGAKLFESNNNSLILYGGVNANGHELRDVWHLHYATKVWTPLPIAPVSTSNAVTADGLLYLIAAEDPVSSDVHILDTTNFETAQWNRITFPTNPLTPGPRPRVGGGLLSISTGYGRNYLCYFFGARQDPHTSGTRFPQDTEEPTQWSDLWTFQIPSSQPEVKATTKIYEALKPAKIKDAIRSALGAETGEHSWAEVDVRPPDDITETSEGKVHPGPRAYFGSDVHSEGKSVVVWGGLNAKGEREGDGWIINFS